MPELIAQGNRPENRWCRPLTDQSNSAVLGRSADPWSVPWDDRISRRHAEIRWDGSVLHVQKLATARNAIFFRGQHADSFRAKIGDHFVIGQTTFTVVDNSKMAATSEQPGFAEQTFSAYALRQNEYRDASHRIDALGKLPEIIASATTDRELWAGIVNLVLRGVPTASAAAIIKLKLSSNSVPISNETSSDQRFMTVSDQTDAPITNYEDSKSKVLSDPDLELLHWESRNRRDTTFAASSRLVETATRTGESVLHVWNKLPTGNVAFTQAEHIDWAYCTPVLSEQCPGWAIYVAGNSTSAFGPGAGKDELQDDLKFTELVSTTLAALREVRVLQRRQDSLRNFFAPVVLEAMAGRDPEQVLTPRETDVSVLFCDLRGFSKRSERDSNQLLELLRRVSDALGVMTHHILQHNGVVGDFQGDAAMGFWGWPLEMPDRISAACKAALAIREEFEAFSQDKQHPLAGFRAGIGIASGNAVAGRIGTTDQVKVTVFGPVVNLAARLEGMTKQLDAPILMDEATAQWIREHVPASEMRVRRVARVLPYGMTTPLTVSELLPSEQTPSHLSNDGVIAYEEALDSFQNGDWDAAFRRLHDVPAEDRVKDFLTLIIAQHRRIAPDDWKGIIELPSK